jgi:SAM-dependent methyltransferase
MINNTIKHCRICGNTNLIPVIDIGEQYLSSIFPKDLNYKNELKKTPLRIFQCVKTGENECGSLQLAHDYDLTEMYENYPYTSSSNSSMKKILENVANSGKALNNLQTGDTVLDIGCNDCTLFDYFKDDKLNLIGIDPAKNIKSVVESGNIKVLKDYFTADNFYKISKDKAKLAFGIAMFYHLHDPVSFCKDLENVLDDNGVAIIQMAYLPAMIKTNMYDNIVHEHAGYYGVQHMKWIMEKAGLKLFDVELNDVYGGSFRVFAKKKDNTNFKSTKRLEDILDTEIQEGIFDTKTYTGFMDRIDETKNDLKFLLKSIKRKGKKVWIYGASTKGNTIMQFCNIGKDLVEAAADSNPFKFNKYMIGTDIPIVDEKELRKVKPDYLLALPYSFVEGFKIREKELLKGGTQFIVPLPEVKIV